MCSVKMFEFYERVSGARMHAAYVRPGGVHQVRGPAPRGCQCRCPASLGGPAVLSHPCLASRTYPLGSWTTFMSFLRTSLFELMSWRR